MSLNPLFDNRFLIGKYKVRVTLIYDWGHDCTFAEYKPVKEFCEQNNIAFAQRDFRPFKYLEDREYVLKLPAFQVYVLDEYERTIYPGVEALQELQAVILGVKILEAEDRRRRLLMRQRMMAVWSYMTWFIVNPKPREPSRSEANPELLSGRRKETVKRRHSFAGSSERKDSNHSK